MVLAVDRRATDRAASRSLVTKKLVLFVAFVVSSRDRSSAHLRCPDKRFRDRQLRHAATLRPRHVATQSELEVEGQKSIRKHGALRTAWSGMRALLHIRV